MPIKKTNRSDFSFFFYLDIFVCVFLERLSLGLEDSDVGLEEVASLHALLSGHGAHHNGVVDASESDTVVCRDESVLQERIRTVLQFHDKALQ